MSSEETQELMETAEALTVWERILIQFHGTLEVGPTRDWVEARIKASRRAGLKTQVQLIRPVVTQPHVLEVAGRQLAPISESEERLMDGNR